MIESPEATIAGAINTSAVRLPDFALRTAVRRRDAPMEWPIDDRRRVPRQASATSPPSMYLSPRRLFAKPARVVAGDAEATLDQTESAANNSWKLSDVDRSRASVFVNINPCLRR